MASPAVQSAVGGAWRACRKSRVSRLGILGGGEVVKKKIWPAVRANGHGLDRIAVCSLESRDPLGEPRHLYHRVGSDSRLPSGSLEAEGFFSPKTLWIVATPSVSHVHYALQLAGVSRVAIEKPLDATAAQARLLRPYASRGFEVYPIDHKLFNASALAFVDACRRNRRILASVRHIEGRFLEKAGFSHGRLQEDCIADVQHHPLVLIRAAFRSTGGRTSMTIDRARVSTHAPDAHGRFAAPRVWTASRLQGRVVHNGQTVTYDLLQAKGAPMDEKFVRFHDADGSVVADVDLGESGWQAHARVLAELLKPRPNMRYGLADAIAVMELIDRGRAMASQEPAYRFGELPGFLAHVPTPARRAVRGATRA